MRTAMRRTVQTAVAGLTATGIVLLSAVPAAAHVTVSASVTTAGSYTVVSVSVPHGCEESSTTKVSIKIPEEIVAVTPTVNPGWTPAKVMADLNPPIKDSHGNEVTQRVTEVVYTAKTPLPSDMRDKFELSLKLPDTPGKKLLFPAVQTCEQGEAAWVQVAADGQNADELEYPAPSFTITEAVKEGDAPATGQNEAVALTNASDNSTSDSGTGAVSWIALALGALGLLLGGYAAVRSHRSSGASA